MTLYPEEEQKAHYIGRIRAAFIDEKKSREAGGPGETHCVEVR